MKRDNSTKTPQDSENKLLSYLTTFIYESMRHEWDSQVCQALIEKMSKLPNYEGFFSDAIQKRDLKNLSAYLSYAECQMKDYFAENLSDDSDDEYEVTNTSPHDARWEINSRLFRKYSPADKVISILQGHVTSLEAFKDGVVNLFEAYDAFLFAPRLDEVSLEIEDALSKKWLKTLRKSTENTILLAMLDAAFELQEDFKRNQRMTKTKKKDYKSAVIAGLKALLVDPQIKNLIYQCNKVSVSAEQKKALKELIRKCGEIEFVISREFERKNLKIGRLPCLSTPSLQQKQDLRRVNRAIKSGVDFRKVASGLKTQFAYVLTRGITHLTTVFNQPSRQAHRMADEKNKPQFARSVFEGAGINLFTQKNPYFELNAVDYALLFDQANRLRQLLIEIKKIGPVRYKNFSYNNLNELFQHYYSNNYDYISEALNDIKVFLIECGYSEEVVALLGQNNPMASYSESGMHPERYGHGVKPYKGHGSKRLRPRWKRSGRAERPYSGKAYKHAILLNELNTEYLNFVPFLNDKRRVMVDNQIIAEREVSFYAMLEGGVYNGQRKVRYPSFCTDYKTIFFKKYGFKQLDYDAFREAIDQTKPHSVARRYVKKLLGYWLPAFHEITEAHNVYRELLKKGIVQVYMGLDGLFYFEPQTVSIRGGNSNGKNKEKINSQKIMREIRETGIPQSTSRKISFLPENALESVPSSEEKSSLLKQFERQRSETPNSSIKLNRSVDYYSCQFFISGSDTPTHFRAAIPTNVANPLSHNLSILATNLDAMHALFMAAESDNKIKIADILHSFLRRGKTPSTMQPEWDAIFSIYLLKREYLDCFFDEYHSKQLKGILRPGGIRRREKFEWLKNELLERGFDAPDDSLLVEYEKAKAEMYQLIEEKYYNLLIEQVGILYPLIPSFLIVWAKLTYRNLTIYNGETKETHVHHAGKDDEEVYLVYFPDSGLYQTLCPESIMGSDHQSLRHNLNAAVLSSPTRFPQKTMKKENDVDSVSSDDNIGFADFGGFKTSQSPSDLSPSEKVYQGLQYQRIPDKGHCLFQAVSLYVNQNVSDLRRIVSEEMEANIEKFRHFRPGTEEDFRSYIQDIRNTEAWGGPIEIEIMQRIMGRPIIVIRPNSNPNVPDNLDEYQGDPIFIYYNGQTHYDAFFLLESFDSREILKNICESIRRGEDIHYDAQNINNSEVKSSNTMPDEDTNDLRRAELRLSVRGSGLFQPPATTTTATAAVATTVSEAVERTFIMDQEIIDMNVALTRCSLTKQ